MRSRCSSLTATNPVRFWVQLNCCVSPNKVHLPRIKSDGLKFTDQRNGDRYAWVFFADKMHGFRVFFFANGHFYEGAWHKGRRRGFRMYAFRNGEIQSGHWQNGILDVPSTQSTVTHVSPIAFNHSKVCNTFQETRRAIEKAYEVTKGDERVNMSVAAANRAANESRVAAVKAMHKQMHHHRRNSDEIPILNPSPIV